SLSACVSRLLWDGRGENVIALLEIHPRHALEGEVDGLRAAGGEDYLLRVPGADEVRDLLAPLVPSRLRFPAKGMVATGRMAEPLGEIGQHRLEDPRIHRGCR